MIENILKLKGSIPDDIYNELLEISESRTISKTQLTQFLANCDHECRGWTKFTESFAYRPERLQQVFGIKRIPSIKFAEQLIAKGPQAIANHVYNGRLGNKLNTNDGWNFRGSGCIQLTGRDNYTRFDATVKDDIINNPELVRTKYKIRTAIWFFDTNGLWSLCTNLTSKNVALVRKRINGGTNGLDDVNRLIIKYSNILK